MASSAEASTRAGRYIAQPTGYRAFMPAPLPPQPALALAGELQRLQKRTGTTYAAANGLVARLVKLGVLSEMTGYARNRRFRYAPYIALFNDAGPALAAETSG